LILIRQETPAVSTVARNLFDWLNFRHDTRQDTRGLPFGTIQGLPDPDKHCLHEQKWIYAVPGSIMRPAKCGVSSRQRIN
jgi:hypothetical protein